MKRSFSIAVLILLGVGCQSPSGKENRASLRGAYDLVDLTHPLDERSVYFPGGSPFCLENTADISQGYYMNRFSMGEHTGTHLDAPAHFSAGQAFVDEIPLESLVAPAAVIDVEEKVEKNSDYLLTVEDIRSWEGRHGTLPEGAVVVMKTGWEKRAGRQEKYRNEDSSGTLHFPGFSKESAEFLLRERRISGIAIDTLSLDYGPSKDFPVHRVMLGGGKYQIENLRNLDSIPPAGATLIICPLKIRKGSGAPARVVALLSRDH